MDRLSTASVAVAHRHLAEVSAEPAWAKWAAQLAPTVAIEAVLAWLNAGQPDPDTSPNVSAPSSQASSRRFGKTAVR
jgi:hypothetical protein